MSNDEQRLDPVVGILGCGTWGANHVRTWHALGKLRLVADIDESRLETIRALYPNVETSTTEGLLGCPEITAVIIATPAPTHPELAIRALEAGKDVLVEKPLALSVAEGRRVVDTAAALGRVLMVGHVLHYHPAVLKLEELIRDGALGQVQYIYSHRLNLGRIRTEENALWSFAPHDISLILSIAGCMPDHVFCQGGAYLRRRVADVTLTTLRFAHGLLAHVFVSWLHPFKEQRFVVVGSEQMAVFDDTAPWEEKLLLYPHRVDWMGGQIPVARRSDANAVRLEEAEPLRAECEAFLDSLRTRATPRTDGDTALRVLQVLEAAGESLAQPEDQRDSGSASGVYVHPTATLDVGAEIGAGTKVWHYSHVMTGAKIGSDCVLGQNVFVGRDVRIGSGVKIQNNVSVYEGVELEDDVFCGPSAVFTNVTRPRSEINERKAFGRTLVRQGATIGANATILSGVTVGSYALIGAAAVVTHEVPDHALVVGSPGRVAGWVCRCGQRLSLDEAGAHCSACGDAYGRNEDGSIRPVV